VLFLICFDCISKGLNDFRYCFPASSGSCLSNSNLLSGLIGATIGAVIGGAIAAWATLKAEKTAREARNHDNAYTAAILIRNWIREKLDYPIQLKENLKNRLRLINEIEIGYRICLASVLPRNFDPMNYKDSYVVTKEPLSILHIDSLGVAKKLELTAGYLKKLSNLPPTLFDINLATAPLEKLATADFLRLDEIISSNAGCGLGRSIIIQLTQSLPKNKHLYKLDFTLIKDLSLMRNKFKKYETILQMLSFSDSWHAQAKSIAELFEDMRNTLLIKKSKTLLQSPRLQETVADIDSEFFQNLENFIMSFRGQCLRWIENLDKLEENIQKILFYFQDEVCVPLNVGKIQLDGIATADELVGEIFRNEQCSKI